MKISVSLPEEDVAVLDAYMRRAGLPSRSAALRDAIGRLDDEALEAGYEQAWSEWEGSEDAALWDRAAGDGIA